MEIKRKEEGVSPVIATILMVAITVVLAATLYMMLPSGSETETTEAMSGRVNSVNDGYVVQIDSGSVSWNSDKIILYNTSTGASSSPNSGQGKSDISITIDEGTGSYTFNIDFNDNDENNNINGGDSFKLNVGTDHQNNIEDNYQFRIKDTSLQIDL